MSNAETKTNPAPNQPFVEKRLSTRINAGDVVNGVTVDPVFRSYLPFRAKVVNISDTGIQLAIKKGSINVEEGTKVLITPAAAKDISGSTRETLVIWSKDQGEATIFGCMFAER